MSGAAPPPRAAGGTWLWLLGAIAVLFLFALWFGAAVQPGEVRTLLFANSRLTAGELSGCLASGFRLTGQGWQPVPGASARIEGWDAARGLRIDINDAAAKGRRVEIATLGGRPLRVQEAEALRRCLAGG